MIPAQIDIALRFAEVSKMHALLVIGVSEYQDKKLLPGRALAFATDELTTNEKLFYSRVLAAVSFGLRTMGPKEMHPQADQLLAAATGLVDEVAKSRTQE